MSKTYGPVTADCDFLHAEKYRARGESFRECATRVANKLSDDDAHFRAFRDILLEMRFLPGGRIQGTMGSTRSTTPYNCFVSGTIEDSFTHGHGSIMARATEAANTMRLGGGIGYDFSTLRPRGDIIKKLQSASSGPVSFMDIFDAVGLATASSGHRRGAQMGVLRVDHPDIEEFVRSKQNSTRLTGFNISVGVTDEFMWAVDAGTGFALRWHGKLYRMIDARALWDAIMRSTFDWSEPGVLFLDTINNFNNLYYCEKIYATNPCGEQPLPPYGACLLGSFNLVKYLERDGGRERWKFNYLRLFEDIPHVVRAMDNVVDRAQYPLHEQEEEAFAKRRMGLGVTGLANTIEALGHEYASPGFLTTIHALLGGMKNACYHASALLAKEKGSFPAYEAKPYLSGRFVRTLSEATRNAIETHGIRNSHLLSIAPTGTISTAADNVSSGIEPVFARKVKRIIQYPAGPQIVELEDYGHRFLGVAGKTADRCSAIDHVKVLVACAQHMDSAVSKTCNVPNDYPWDDFKDLYMLAWKQGAKGITTHRMGNFRGAVISDATDGVKPPMEEPLSCELNPETGVRSCE